MSNREGFGIVEVVVAMVLLAIIMTTLGGLTFATARQAVVADQAMTRQAIALQTVNRLSTLPYANLPGAAGCTTEGPTNRRFQTCVTVTNTSGGVNLQIVTTPLQNNVPAVTMRLVRNAPPTGNPLCLGC